MEDIVDWLVQYIEPDNSILRKQNFNVNIRLYKNNKDYKVLIDAIIAHMKKILYLNFNNYLHSPVGISGANVGIPFNIIIVKDKEIVMINPHIFSYSKEKERARGACGSLIGHEPVLVERSTSVVVNYFDCKSLRYLRRSFGGFTAKVIQHEIDHNNGILLIDREIK